MITIESKDRGITSGEDITVRLIELFNELKDIKEEKIVIFEKGIYHISSKLCDKNVLFITNSMGDREWKSGEKPHNVAMAINIQDINDLTLIGNGSIFMVDGQAVNIVINNCKNVILSDLIIDCVNPDMHELKVINKGGFFVDFELDKDSKYISEKGKYYFIGPDYKTSFYHKRKIAFWTGIILNNNQERVKRTAHPFMLAMGVKEISGNRFRGYYLLKPRCDIGDKFYVYDVRRKHAGIFINSSQNITLRKVQQRFNYGLALVMQDSDTIEIDEVNFAPKEDGAKAMASVADFIQVSMCRGMITIKDSIFCGAGDDCLNVHGIHFKIVKIIDNRIIVKFMHPQTHGFNPLRVGDTITYVDRRSLICRGESRIVSSQLLNEYNIEIELDNVSHAEVGMAIEDIDACPDVEFSNNTLSRIITRGILLTTRGKVIVSNNKFINTTMSNILISDDAKNWYESGCVRQVLIEGNEFLECGGYTVIVKPENSIDQGAVHSGVSIIENKINNPKFYFKSVDNVVLKDNMYLSEPTYKIVKSRISIDK